MITFTVLDDQELAVAAERPGEHDVSIIGRDHLGVGAGFDGDSLAAAAFGRLAEASDDAAAGRHGQAAPRGAERASGPGGGRLRRRRERDDARRCAVRRRRRRGLFGGRGRRHGELLQELAQILGRGREPRGRAPGPAVLRQGFALQRELARVQRREPPPFGGETVGRRRELEPFGGDLAAKPGERVELGAQASGLVVEQRHHGAEEQARADRVVDRRRRGDQGLRRLAAEPLERAQRRRERRPAPAQRFALVRVLAGEPGEARLERGHVLFVVLRGVGGLDQIGAQPRDLARERRGGAFQPLALRALLLERAFDRLELLVDLVDAGEGVWRGGDAGEDREHDRRNRPGPSPRRGHGGRLLSPGTPARAAMPRSSPRAGAGRGDRARWAPRRRDARRAPSLR